MRQSGLGTLGFKSTPSLETAQNLSTPIYNKGINHAVPLYDCENDTSMEDVQYSTQ